VESIDAGRKIDRCSRDHHRRFSNETIGSEYITVITSHFSPLFPYLRGPYRFGISDRTLFSSFCDSIRGEGNPFSEKENINYLPRRKIKNDLKSRKNRNHKHINIKVRGEIMYNRKD